MKIGVFDSGLGGLTILKGIVNTLPEYEYIYYGDNANVPYGGKSEGLIYKLSKKAIDYLFQHDCKLIVVACNTVSAVALSKIQQEYLPQKWPDRKVLGILVPAMEEIAESNATNLGIIGTYATANSKYIKTELKERYPNKEVTVHMQACPLLVPIIEEGESDWEGMDLLLEKYLSFVSKEKIDTLLLGCTHYSLIADKIKNKVGDKVKVIDESEIIGVKLKEYLSGHPEIEKELKKAKSKSAKIQYEFTDYSERYERIAKMFLGDLINVLYCISE